MIVYYSAIVLTYVFILITGFHDEGNLIATIIASKSLSPKITFIVACISQFAGTVLIGDKVAKTMAFGIIRTHYITSYGSINLIIASAILGAILWNMITWHYSIPSSSSHALIGGIMGPFVMSFGFKSLNIYLIIVSVLIPLFSSPVIGYVIGFMMMRLNNKLLGKFSTWVNGLLKKLHIVTMVLINMAQGSNDAQKGMGILLILLIANSGNQNAALPLNIKIISGLMISSGLLFGGLKMIKSIGTKVYKVKPVHSFDAQLSSLIIILAASKMGAPISGTQVVNSTIIGIGAAERPSAVGWQYAKSMILGWFITIPCSFIFSALIYLLFKEFV